MAALQKHLIVDGWNVIRSDPEMGRAFAELGQDAAKKMLAARLGPIHDAFGYRLTIVYDGRGDDISVEKVGRSATFSEVYTPSSMTADELIEQLCATSKNPKSLTVASRDNLIRLTAMGFSVESLTSSQLLEWAASASKYVARRYSDARAEAERGWREASSPFSALGSPASGVPKPRGRRRK